MAFPEFSVLISDWKYPYRKKGNNPFISITVRIKSDDIKFKYDAGDLREKFQQKGPKNKQTKNNQTLKHNISKKILIFFNLKFFLLFFAADL